MTTRAKLRVESVKLLEGGEEIQMRAVCKTGAYPADGSDEDNTYAKFSPSADFRLYVTNEKLFGQFKPGQKFYADLTLAPA